ncbi:Uncharacterized protein OBRU01_15792 [Operophtera brumata]|uniref:NICE-3 family protein n=1 Tax=Operophtera brumata TaxID=104452 RepID=A0A0L7L469_OPEBR|nr:Uncharacterized protein OBRU01_15792 [Operophtera brumata]
MHDFTSQNIIFIIAAGVLTFVILFIFAKRQITRFALRSRRGPHVPIGADAKKCLKKEIERRIEAVPLIMHEPRLLSTEPSHYILEPQQPYHYRFRAVDDVKTLDEISRQDPALRRHPRESLRAFLLSSLAAPLDGRGQKLVHQFCDTYEYARHHPGEFGEDDARLLSRVGMCRGSSPRPQATRRPAARLLDAARLRPDNKIEDEVIRVPVKSPIEVKPPPADETAV